MRKLLPGLLILTLAAVAVADDTTRPSLRRKPARAAVTVTRQVPDTLPALGGEIAVTGYDKPLNSRRATFHVTSAMPDTVEGFIISLDYRDLSGRQLHHETVTVDCTLPPDETRLVSIPSWDTQGRYFYSRGKQPRAKGVTPFEVNARIISIILHLPKNEHSL